jgi:hypothetical protein
MGMGVYPKDAIRLLADGLALVYHEARHARHLVKAGHISPIGWDRLLSLPTNRVDAWRAIQAIRKKAAYSATAASASSTFEQRFGKSLADLQHLYSNNHWKHAASVGGHAWCGVTAAVINLRDAILQGSLGEIESEAQLLLAARHNNGAVRDKIIESMPRL